MKTLQKTFTVVLLFTQLAVSQTIPKTYPATWTDFPYEKFGDYYPTYPRTYSDIGICLSLQGPGNNNPGNFKALSNPILPDSVLQFIKRQCKYVLFDQESFAQRSSEGAPATALFTSTYHSQAQAIMNGTDIVVLAYFSPTLMLSSGLYPVQNRFGFSSDWYLKDTSGVRIIADDGVDWLMDITNASWRSFYISYVNEIVTTYGYNGVLIDVANTYPWATSSDRSKIPPDKVSNWAGSLMIFLQDIRSALPAGTKIIYNGAKLTTGTWPNTYIGTSYGLEFLPYADGVWLEGFYESIANPALNALLSVMQQCKDANKLFLGASHYARTWEPTLSMDVFSLPPADLNALFPAPLSTYYRMQMSYLAYYLLQWYDKAYFNFQPGYTLYQFIPYYKPWDERVGAPIAAYSDITSGHYYYRPFTNAEVYVNYSRTLTTQITVPEGYYYYSYNGASANNISAQRASSPTALTLNPMEGIVLFRKIQADQQLSTGASVDSIGHWYRSKFVMHKAPATLPLALNTSEIVWSSQKVISSEKYHDWNSLPDVTNHKSFQMTSFSDPLNSHFKSTNTAHIQTVLDGVPVISSLDFSDPWLIDLTDSYGKRNQGSGAPLKSIATTFTSAPTDTGYQGVFLGQTVNLGTYYSVRTLLTNPNIGGFTGYFQNWSGTNATFQQVGSNPSGYDQKAVVFGQANAVVTANYKGHLASNSTTALASNSQRKIVGTGGGYYHLVYQSVGDIWYTYSTDNGATWAPEQMVSRATDGHQNSNPAVDVDGLGNVYVVYEAPFGLNRAIAIKQKVGMTWTLLWSESFLASSELKPVIAVSKESPPKVVVVVQANGYTSSDPGLYYAQYGYPVGKVSETSASSLNPTLAYGNLAYQESNTIYRKSVLFTNPITISSREAVSTAGFNGRPLRDISNPSIAVREALDYEISRRPVIVWQAIDLIFSDYRPIFVRHPVSTSGGSPVFVTTVFDWGTYNAHGRTPTVNVYQTPPDLGWENPDVSVVWQDDPIDGRYGTYQNVVVANKINGSWNTQTTLSTAGQYSSVAQGSVSQTTSGGALVCWSGTSGSILGISASQKTNSYSRPPKEEDISALQKSDSVTNNATEYAREININLGALGIEGLTGTVGVHIEETTGAKFVPLGKLGSLEKDFLKLQNQTQSAATVKYKVWVYDLQIPQALTIPQRGLEIASLLIRKDSVASRKKNFTLENLLGLWKANHSKLGSVEVAQDSGEVVVPTGTFVQVQTRQDTASQSSGVTYLQIIAPDNGEQLRKQPEQKIIANQPPGEFALAPNYPNPFNPETQIKYQLKDGGYAKLAIYDVLGREIAVLADEYQPAGYYSKSWNANLLASGMYIYRLTVRDESAKQIFTQTKRMMLTK